MINTPDESEQPSDQSDLDAWYRQHILPYHPRPIKALLGLLRILIAANEEIGRQARLDEHRILAGLDDEGRKRRYLELAQEGR